jgi:hypothetical protein
MDKETGNSERIGSNLHQHLGKDHLMVKNWRGKVSWLNLRAWRYLTQSLFCVSAFLFLANSTWSQDWDVKSAPVLDTAQIVASMERHDLNQAQTLKHYHAVRHYSIVYRGFGRTITAAIETAVDYDEASGKSFRIISRSGSKTLCHRVLERAVESEREAWKDKASTALSEANYVFRLLGTDQLDGHPAYVLAVEPIKPNKFLYKGKIWVDAIDFAVKQMEVQPAKNPSFWISRTLIRHSNQEVAGFLLPERNQSTTEVRIGGTAVMTIDYGTYQTDPQAAPRTVSSLTPIR